MSQFGREEVIECINQLIEGEIVVAAPEAERASWEPTALAYHRVSRRAEFNQNADTVTNRPTFVPQQDRQLIPLDAPLPVPQRDFADVLDKRRSTREWSDRSITRSEFSTLLWMSARNRTPHLFSDDGDFLSRPYPSGCAVHSLELCPVVGPAAVESIPAGVYRYRPGANALEQLSHEPAAYEPFLDAGARRAETNKVPVVLIATSRVVNQGRIYRNIAYSLLLKEVGALFQTLYLVAEYLGLAACALGGGSPDNLLARLIGCATVDHPVVGEFVVGPR